MVSKRAIAWARSLAREGKHYCPRCQGERATRAEKGLVICKTCGYSLYINPYMPTRYDTELQREIAESDRREGEWELKHYKL